MNDLLKDAVSLGSVDDLIDLLKKGVNPNQKYENGFAPLHVAASVNQSKCLVLLLESGANRSRKPTARFLLWAKVKVRNSLDESESIKR